MATKLKVIEDHIDFLDDRLRDAGSEEPVGNVDGPLSFKLAHDREHWEHSHLSPPPHASANHTAMADLTPVIETMENRWMRAWVQRDVKTLKSMTSKDFILLTASKPAMILDRPSWLEAVAKRYDCLSFAFGDIYVREWGSTALFTAPLELKATIDDEMWSGPLFMTDLWRRGRVRRGWKLVQRVVSKTDNDPRLAKTIRALQLWK